jgi:hypothetical protein
MLFLDKGRNALLCLYLNYIYQNNWFSCNFIKNHILNYARQMLPCKRCEEQVVEHILNVTFDNAMYKDKK